MKTLAILLLLTSTAFGEVYVYTEKQTGEVLFITEEKNVVIDEGQRDGIIETVLPNDIAFYNLEQKYTDYILSGRKFILNTEKITREEDAINTQKEVEQTRLTALQSAKTKLIALGLTSVECDAFLK